MGGGDLSDQGEPEMRLAYPILATFLLTGGRFKEVVGLALEEVDFDRETITFRPHPWHDNERLKTEGSERTVPLWPQLAEILSDYVEQVRNDHAAELLFPPTTAKGRASGRPIGDIRDLFDRVLVRADFLTPILDDVTGEQKRATSGRREWKGRAIRTRETRVTYTAARLQTTDGGAPRSHDTVMAELGHGAIIWSSG
jgi:integrase